VEIHPVLVEDETGVMVREMQRMLEQSGLTLDQFFSATNSTEADYRKQIEPEARERVKRDLVLDAIANAEGVEATETEQQAWLSMLSAMGGQQLRLRELSAGQRQHVINRVRRDKVVAHVVEAAGGHAHHLHDHDHDHEDEGAEASVTSALSAAIEAEELEREIETAPDGEEQPTTATAATDAPTETAPEGEA
jgi:FKBP-type peptidyl-prolyl cis-trans isomerase (trigger factor)